MSIEEYAAMVKKVIERINQKTFMNRILVAPSIKFLANLKNRIQKGRLDSTENQIGRYSTTEIWVPKSKFVKTSAFKAQGKGSITERRYIIGIGKTGAYEISKGRKKVQISSKTGERNRYMYLQNGYKQLREIQGMWNGDVDLTYSGSMMQAYQFGKSEEKKEVLIGFINKEEAKKAQGNEQHFGKKIFTGSPEEIEAFKQDVFKAYTNFVSQALKGIYGSQDISEA